LNDDDANSDFYQQIENMARKQIASSNDLDSILSVKQAIDRKN